MKRALVILAGCPSGATEAALAMHGVTRRQLESLIDSGKVMAALEYVASAKIMVTRFHIARVS